jgi:uncharacterized protein YbbC (DUF1343 family)
VIAAKNWQRDAWFDETGLPWINPSPNMRNLIQATVYPGIGAIETTNLSVGRGTDTPFEQFGAPWIDANVLAEALNARRIPGIRFYPVRFTPASSKYAGQECQGVFLIVTDRTAPSGAARRQIAAMLHKCMVRRSNWTPPNGSSARGRLRAYPWATTRRRSPRRGAPAEARWRLLPAPYLLYR